ncbi:MAG: aldo/keto reductase [Clostridia bacterium]|nr:aldo/keto reductase [Clostridia bacterium]
MNYTEKNGLKISKMTLGTVQLGMNYGVNNSSGMPSEEQSFTILDAAYEGGVTILDTSDDYGKSEEVIGAYLRKNPDKHFDICTKFKVTEETSKDIYNSLKTFALASCKKLSIDRIPIFMSHTEKNYIDYGERLVEALNELKKDGIIVNSAISLSNKDAFERIIDCGGFEAVQIPLNILDNKEIQNGLVKKASDAGIAVFVRSVYLQGLFFRKKEDFLVQNPNAPTLKLKEMNEKVLPVIERVREFADELNISVAQLAMSFIKDTYGVDSLVVGSETPEQVKSNLEMFNQPELSKEVLSKILNEFKNVDPFVISPWEWEKRK